VVEDHLMYVAERADVEGNEPDMVDGKQVGEFHRLEPAAETDDPG
jgi:hypothetical protein